MDQARLWAAMFEWLEQFVEVAQGLKRDAGIDVVESVLGRMEADAIASVSLSCRTIKGRGLANLEELRARLQIRTVGPACQHASQLLATFSNCILRWIEGFATVGHSMSSQICENEWFAGDFL